VRVKANRAVKAAEDEVADDFTSEPPVEWSEAPAMLQIDRAAWESRVRDWSALFRGHPQIHDAVVTFWSTSATRWLVNSDGSRVQTSRTWLRVSFDASTTADDGMELRLRDAVDAANESGMPDETEVRRRIESLIERIVELRNAPVAEPYVGPAILSGHAAGVYFHEILGHRVEAHRLKDSSDGQTFARQIGKPITSSFIDVFDDPRASKLDGNDLNGHYRIDDEGVAAQRASVIEAGVLTGFLMSRSPLEKFPKSNGHGRRQEGRDAVARQGNLIVHAGNVVSAEALKARLLEEVGRQNKPYGLRLVRVEGGFTTTGRNTPQAFKVMPVLVYRVFPDGREELLRGADLEGTPLTSLSKILAASNQHEVFNGFCGAESGSVPVSASSPSLLVEQVEIARKAKASDRPPLLPAPPIDGEKR
jgi:TldD protein